MPARSPREFHSATPPQPRTEWGQGWVKPDAVGIHVLRGDYASGPPLKCLRRRLLTGGAVATIRHRLSTPFLRVLRRTSLWPRDHLALGGEPNS